MNFDDINFKKIDKVILKKELKKNFEYKMTRKTLRGFLNNIELHISKGDYLVTRNRLLVTLFYEPGQTFDFIRRKGLFRYSKYVNKKCIIEPLASELLEIGKEFENFSSHDHDYLESIINFSGIYDSYQAIEQFIIKEFKSFERSSKGKSIIKSLLSATDFLFLSNHHPEKGNDLSELSNRTKEEIASAVSYLIHFYSDRIKSANIDVSRVDEEYIKSGSINRLIVPACYHVDFREFEIMIDSFKYTCKKEKNQLYIKPPFEDFEKSIRAGYIRSAIQTENDRIDGVDAISLEEFIDKLNELEEFKFFAKTETYNYPRYRLEFPEPVYAYIIEHFIKPDALFKEEVVYLYGIFKEQLLTPDDLKKVLIKDDLTLFDFMKIRRIYLMLYMMFAKEIYKIEKVDTDLLLRSLIPVQDFDQYHEMMEMLFPNEKIESFLDIVCWEPGLDYVFDLQYHPILFLSNQFITPLSIFANSNTIRNLYASQYKKSNSALLGTGENLVAELTRTFEKVGIPCFSEISIKVTDIDVCAVFEDTLFIFECKQSLHPVSPYDLRTTFDYIQKAESQLGKISGMFESGELMVLLERKLKIRTDGIKHIVSCIVLSNRLFNGNIFQYPVRNIHEIKNMLLNGEMHTEEGTFSVWKEGELTKDFMLDYFSLTNELTDLLKNSLSSRTLTYEFTEPPILFDSYYLDARVALPKLKEYTDKLERVEKKDS